MSNEFTINDSGQRLDFESGMVRDTEVGKTDFTSIFHGPMAERWAEHCTKGRNKYEDIGPDVPNWSLANGMEEYLRYRRSAMRHMVQWLAGDVDEDHAAAVMFNLNGAEYVKDRMRSNGTWPEEGTGHLGHRAVLHVAEDPPPPEDPLGGNEGFDFQYPEGGVASVRSPNVV